MIGCRQPPRQAINLLCVCLCMCLSLSAVCAVLLSDCLSVSLSVCWLQPTNLGLCGWLVWGCGCWLLRSSMRESGRTRKPNDKNQMFSQRKATQKKRIKGPGSLCIRKRPKQQRYQMIHIAVRRKKRHKRTRIPLCQDTTQTKKR